MGNNIDIEHIAKLANLPLSEEEKRHYAPQIESIVSFVEKLNEVDTNNIEPTYHVAKKVNELREDTISQSLTQEQALQNAPSTDGESIITKGVFNGE